MKDEIAQGYDRIPVEPTPDALRIKRDGLYEAVRRNAEKLYFDKNSIVVYFMKYLFTHFSPVITMRQYIHDNKIRFWQTLFLLYLVSAFLAPSFHSHDHRHDYGKGHHALAQGIAAAQNLAVHNAGEGSQKHTDDTFGADFSRHDHNSNQHAHFLENPPQGTKRGAGGLEKHKAFFLRALSARFVFKNRSCKVFSQASPITPLSNPEYVFVAIDLPPPTA